MTADRPDAHELIDACAHHLGQLLDGPGRAGRYDLRLLERALTVARAELRLGPDVEQAEARSLRSLLGADGDGDGDDRDVDTLRARLAGEIRAGAWALDDVELLAHLRADTARRLRVSGG